MSFQIKDFVSITAAILNHARATTTKITDWVPGSVARTLVEAPAVEIEEFYLQTFTGLRDAIPVAIFRSFAFDKLLPAYAHGFVSVSNPTLHASPLPIPIGTEFTTSDGRKYLSTELVTWGVLDVSVRIPVAAEFAGVSYNVSVNAITSSVFFDANYVVGNSTISNGRDLESDSEQEARFSDYILSISQGSVSACTYAVRAASILDGDGNLYEYVTKVGVVERAGYVRIYIYSSRGLPSVGLIAAAQLAIDGDRGLTGDVILGVRAAGVRVNVFAMAERLVDFTSGIIMLDGYTLTAAVIQQMRDLYASLLANTNAGETLYIDTIETAFLGVVGVKTVVPSVASNIVCGKNETLLVGSFVINAL